MDKFDLKDCSSVDALRIFFLISKVIIFKERGRNKEKALIGCSALQPAAQIHNTYIVAIADKMPR